MELRLSARDFSLEYSANTEDSNRLPVETVPDYRPTPVELIEEFDDIQHKHEAINTALAVLNDKERFIIENRILKDEPDTLQEVGEKLNITRERVRQIEARALEKLKKSLKEKNVH